MRLVEKNQIYMILFRHSLKILSFATHQFQGLRFIQNIIFSILYVTRKKKENGKIMAPHFVSNGFSKFEFRIKNKIAFYIGI